MYNGNRGSLWANMPPVTKNLIIINLIVWGFTFLAPRTLTATVTGWCGLHYVMAPDFNVAQLVTYMFMHDSRGLAHILFNMFALFMFGTTIELTIGSRRFLFYYLSCGIGAAIIQECVWLLTVSGTVADMYPGYPTDMLVAAHPEILNIFVTIGASGAIYGVLLAFGMMFPDRELFLFFIPVPIKAKWMVIGYGVLELLIGISNASDGVAHFAHLGGMIVGLLIILYWRKKGIIHRRYY